MKGGAPIRLFGTYSGYALTLFGGLFRAADELVVVHLGLATDLEELFLDLEEKGSS